MRDFVDAELGKVVPYGVYDIHLYDDRVRGERTDDFRDIANAVSLLARLDLGGVDVGCRCDELSDLAGRRTEDRSLVFASLHSALALISPDRGDHAKRLAAGLREGAGHTYQQALAREIVAPAAMALIAFRGRRYGEAARLLLALRPSLRRIGGSNAQRDLFKQMLIEVRIRDGTNQRASILP